MVAAVVALALCSGVTGAQPDAPPWRGLVDLQTRSTVLNYARGLSYDTSMRVVGRVHADYLEDSVRRTGPTIEIQPVRQIARVTRTQLRSGRIVARVISSGPFLRLALQSDTTYWWIDGGNFRGRELRGKFFPTDPSMMVMEMACMLHGKIPPAGNLMAWGTFNATTGIEGLNTPCPLGCCACPPHAAFSTHYRDPVRSRDPRIWGSWGEPMPHVARPTPR